MQKINLQLIDKLIENKCSSIEINLLLYIAARQNEFGQVRNIYYKDACLSLDISSQSFYSALDGLNNKGIITLDNTNTWGDWTCTINNNIYLNDNDYKNKAYINTNKYYFLYSKEFMNASVNIKYIVLNLLKCMREEQNFKISLKKLKEYAKVLGDAVFEYIEYIRQWFNIRVKGEVYYISVRADLKQDNNSEVENYLIHKIKAYCKKYRVCYTIESLQDLLILFKQYSKKLKVLWYAIATTTIQYHSIEPKLINKICCQ